MVILWEIIILYKNSNFLIYYFIITIKINPLGFISSVFEITPTISQEMGYFDHMLNLTQDILLQSTFFRTSELELD